MEGMKGRRSASFVGNIILQSVKIAWQKWKAFGRERRERDYSIYNVRAIRWRNIEIFTDGK